MHGSSNSEAPQTLSEIFELSLSREQYLSHYQGIASWVIVKSVAGRRVKFPAANLKPFVSYNGVHGVFKLQYSATGKIVLLERIK